MKLGSTCHLPVGLLSADAGIIPPVSHPLPHQIPGRVCLLAELQQAAPHFNIPAWCQALCIILVVCDTISPTCTLALMLTCASLPPLDSVSKDSSRTWMSLSATVRYPANHKPQFRL